MYTRFSQDSDRSPAAPEEGRAGFLGAVSRRVAMDLGSGDMGLSHGGMANAAEIAPPGAKPSVVAPAGRVFQIWTVLHTLLIRRLIAWGRLRGIAVSRAALGGSRLSGKGIALGRLH